MKLAMPRANGLQAGKYMQHLRAEVLGKLSPWAGERSVFSLVLVSRCPQWSEEKHMEQEVGAFEQVGRDLELI